MVSLKRKQSGFTIVELLIVIVVIGILATLVIVTFTGIQQRARNTKRQTDINAIQSHVEAYYADNGMYPTLANLNSAAFVSTNLKGLDPAAMQDPSWSTSIAACTTSGAVTMIAAPAADCYAYSPGPSGCDDSATNCTSYTLTATYEGTVNGATTYVKQSH
jgi:prepilin-type N-terminal cleavage/methylation domain-containing protein